SLFLTKIVVGIFFVKNNDIILNKQHVGLLSKEYYKTIFTKTDLVKLIKELQSAKCFAFDIETDSFDILSAHLIGLSFAIEKGKAVYLPLGHDYLDAPQQLPLDEVLAVIKPILIDENIQKVGQNLKFDYSIMAKYNIDIKSMAFDTMLESYVLKSVAGFIHHDMNSLAKRHLSHKTIIFKDIAGKGKNKLTFNKITVEEASIYAAKDADVTLLLHK
ncbi:MAG: DNA polymerase I, partial [Arsenophonus sp. ET-DL12-MAG3]